MKNSSILIIALLVAAYTPNTMANTARDRSTSKYKRCIDAAKRVSSKDDAVGMIVRCREYALKQQR